MTPKARSRFLASLTDQHVQLLLHDWRYWSRKEQRFPAGDWFGWMFLAGRGTGKTRSGAEQVREWVKEGFTLIHIIAPTSADLRKVIVEGPAGINACSWENDFTHDGQPMGRPVYESSNKRLIWGNGALALLFSAEEPERLRGPQCEKLWADELAAWPKAQDVWDMAMFGLRLGADPQFVVTTTPKPLAIIRDLVKDETVAVTRGRTVDNRANLASRFLKTVVERYAGTRLGRQELDGEILEDVEGALWRRSEIVYRRDNLPDFVRIVVAVDPPASSGGESALAGIIVAALGLDGNGYVLADRSGRKTPGEWAATAIACFDEFQADLIIAEGNQGGEMVTHTIQTARANVPVQLVYASRGKQARAEPVAALYAKGQVFHVEPFPELEDQLCTWEPLTGTASPDRLDAMVWAMTALLVGSGARVLGPSNEAFVVDPVRIMANWKRVAALYIDRTHVAASFIAWHEGVDIAYVYDEYFELLGPLPVHAEAIRTKAKFAPVLFDLRGSKRREAEGLALAQRLQKLSLDVFNLPFEVEAGVIEMSSRITTGRLKVFNTCGLWLNQYRTFRRDEDAEILPAGAQLMITTGMASGDGLTIAMSENRALSDAEGLDEGAQQRAGRGTGY